jgi:uncharacterized membrane protein
MEEVTILLSRWIHIGTAIVLLGGMAFQRFVLLPSAAELPDAEHDKLRASVMGRWKKFVHMGIGLLLLTGFYNYLGAPTPAAEPIRWKLYHPLVGTKILIALALFVMSSGMVGRSHAFAGLRANPKRTLTIMLILGSLIVGISGFLKVGGAKATRAKIPAVSIEG